MDREIESAPIVRKPGWSEEISGDGGNGDDRIRCPFCRWSPSAHHLWTCSCRHTWNTFDTGGVCPRCLLQWMHTQCLNCHQWSGHSAWYPEG